MEDVFIKIIMVVKAACSRFVSLQFL